VELVVERAAALDVGKDEVVACIRVPDPAGAGRGRGRRRQEVRTYPTFTSSLEALADWLQGEGITQVVMEATGQYWKPCWYVLEERGLELLLVNARHVKILPGRKTDVGDAAWLAELLECGLLRGSFVPPPAIRELRDLTRYRKRLIQAHSAECQRIQKTLQDAGIKLDSVAADILGVSGRAMLTALVAGERDPKVLAELAKGRLRAKLPQLRQALRGRFGEHHALLVGLALDHLEHLEQAIATLDGRIDAVIAPFAVARDRLDTNRRGWQARRRGHHRRDRRRHVGLPDRRPPGLLGGPLPGQQPHRRQAPLRQAHQGQPLAWRDAHRVRLGRRPQPRHLPGRPVLAAGPTHRQEEGRRRRRPLDPGDRLAPAGLRLRLPGPWRRLLRATRHRPCPSASHRPTPDPRLPGHPPTHRRLTPPGIHVSG
jgi:transposase